MSVNSSVTVTRPLYDDRLRVDRLGSGGRSCVRIRVLEDVHRARGLRPELEPVAAAPVVDDDAEAVGVAVPEERDGDAVVFPMCEFSFHIPTLADDRAPRKGANQHREVRLAAPSRAGSSRDCESPPRAG